MRQEVRDSIALADLSGIQILKITAARTGVSLPQTLDYLCERWVQVLINQSGLSRCRYNNRWISLAPSQWCVFEEGPLHVMALSSATECLAVLMPMTALHGLMDISSLTLRPMRGTAGFGRLIRYTAQVLFEEAAIIPEAEARSTAEALLGRGIALALREAQDETTLAPSAFQDLHQLACQKINDRLDDPLLTVSRIAQMLNITVRRLQRCFQVNGETVRGYILHQRLDRCYNDLMDSRQASRKVADIALRWGFSDLSYFSVAFRKRFGLSPRAARHAIRKGFLN